MVKIHIPVVDSIHIEIQNTVVLSNRVQYQENGNHLGIAIHYIHIYMYSRVQVTGECMCSSAAIPQSNLNILRPQSPLSTQSINVGKYFLSVLKKKKKKAQPLQAVPHILTQYHHLRLQMFHMTLHHIQHVLVLS